MSTEIAQFYASIGADVSGFSKGLDQVKGGLAGLTTGFGQLTDMTATAMKAGGIALSIFGGAIAKTGIEFDAMKEQANVAFTTMLGSGQAAQGMLNELQDFAAKTPFEFPDLITASQRLMAMGFQAQEVIPTLTAIGDAVAAMGGSAEMVDRVTTALGQMNAKGVVSAEEMRQLTEAGIPAWQMLADKIGVTVPEAMDMVTKRAVTSAQGISALTEGIETRFGGMMEAQSHTWLGIISNIKDGFGQISGQIMAPFFDMAKVGLENVAAGVSAANMALQNGKGIWEAFQALLAELIPRDMLDQFNHFIEIVQNAYTAISAVIKPVIAAIGQFVKWQDVMTAVGVVIVAAIGSIVASFAPMFATFIAITAAVAGLREAWENDFLGIRTFTKNTLDKLTDWFYKDSGIWKGTWEKTLDYLKWWADSGWKIYVFFPVRSWLIQTVFEINRFALETKAEFNAWFGDMKERLSIFVNDWVMYFINMKDRMLSAYHAWADPILREIGYWWDGVVQQFNWGVQWIIGDFGIWTRLVDFLKDSWQGVMDWFDRNIRPWIDYGRDMIQGLWDGISERWNSFYNWLTDKWNSIKEKTRAILGIHSPSTVFYDFGINMMAGMAQGITNATGMVTGALDGLGADVNATVTGGYGISGSSGVPAVSTARIEQLLLVLIAELRNKNMNVTVNGGGDGAGYGGLVALRAGLR